MLHRYVHVLPYIAIHFLSKLSFSVLQRLVLPQVHRGSQPVGDMGCAYNSQAANKRNLEPGCTFWKLVREW